MTNDERAALVTEAINLAISESDAQAKRLGAKVSYPTSAQVCIEDAEYGLSHGNYRNAAERARTSLMYTVGGFSAEVRRVDAIIAEIKG